MRSPRVCCLDLDTFFVSVERLLDPSLRGRPVVVGGRRWGRGVVTSASYEARAFGVRSGISIREASERASADTVFVPGHGDEYSSYSKRARAIVERFSPVVVAASIDECYLDLRGCERLYRRPGDTDDDATILRTVRELTRTIEDELGLPASAGIATSRSLAKVVSGLAKPAGVLLIRAGTEAATLAPLPVRKLPGIGPVAETRLRELGIETLAQLVVAPDAALRPIFGAYLASIRRAAVGEGSDELGRERPAFQEHDPHGAYAGTISNERTFIEVDRDTSDRVLSGLCERLGARARGRGILAGQVTLKLRYTDFHTVTRARTIAPTNVDVVLHRVVVELYREARTRRLPVRLLGVALARLRLDAVQLPLFDADDRRSRAVDDVREKFGYDSVHLASTVARDSRDLREDPENPPARVDRARRRSSSR